MYYTLGNVLSGYDDLSAGIYHKSVKTCGIYVLLDNMMTHLLRKVQSKYKHVALHVDMQLPCETSYVMYFCTDMEVEKDIRRLKKNWVFIAAAYLVNAINYSCVLPTCHQFIINPTAEALNITNEV